MPGSPLTRTTWPTLSLLCSQRRVSKPISSSRPTRGSTSSLSVASKRSSSPAKPVTRQAAHRLRDSPHFVAAQVVVREHVAHELSRHRADDDAIGRSLFKSPCMRAARFGVSPTTVLSSAEPSPIMSPTTVRPVAIPMRTANSTLLTSPTSALRPAIASTMPRPVRTARSASFSCAGGSRSRRARRRPCTWRRVVAGDHCGARGLIARITSCRSSGSSRADSAVEPTRSQNITVSCRRSAPDPVGSAARGRDPSGAVAAIATACCTGSIGPTDGLRGVRAAPPVQTRIPSPSSDATPRRAPVRI